MRELDPVYTTPGVWYESTVTGAGVVGTVDLTGAAGTLDSGQPLPIGALRVTTTSDNNDRAHAGVSDDLGLIGNILPTLEFHYSSYKASNGAQNLSAAPSLKLTVFDVGCNDPSSAGDCFGTLVFEPTWNQPGFEGSSSAVPLDTWQAWDIDADNGLFWWSGGFGQPNTAGGPPLRTLNQWLSVMSSDFTTATITVVEIGVGSYNQNQLGYFDDVSIAHAFGSGYSESWDFEPLFDCNNNGIHDPDDIAALTSLDCNSNGIPDECDILAGTSIDCQPNGIPDECEGNVATIVNYFDAVDPLEAGTWFEIFITSSGAATTTDLTGFGGDLENNQPAPSGAALLTTTSDNNDRANVGFRDDFGLLVDILPSLQLGYSSYKGSAAGTALAPAPSMKIEVVSPTCPSMGDCFGTLVFEPYWNQPGFEGSAVNPPLDTWQDWSIDADNGLWWWTGGFGVGNEFGGPPTRTLGDWLTAFSASGDFADAVILSIQVGVGSFNQNQVGYFDSVRVQHTYGAGYSECFDFEPIVDCNGNSVHDALDIELMTSQDCNGNGIPDECDLLAGSADCNANLVPDECEPASVAIYGSGVNPAGSMTILSGSGSIGTTLVLGIDNPAGTQAAGSLPFVFLANAPDPNFPAGTLMPNFGMSAPGSPGELLISIAPPNPLTPALIGPPWSGPGMPSPVAVVIPLDCGLVGLDFYGQGLMFDLTQPVGHRLRLTDAIHLTGGY